MAVKVFIIHTLYIIIFLLMFAVWFLKEFKYKICSLSWMIQLHNLQNVIIKSWCYCNLRYSYFPEENSSVFLYKEQCHKMCFLVSISFWSQNAHILSSMGSHFYSTSLDSQRKNATSTHSHSWSHILWVVQLHIFFHCVLILEQLVV